jgi:hypothetical protein
MQYMQTCGCISELTAANKESFKFWSYEQQQQTIAKASG